MARHSLSSGMLSLLAVSMLAIPPIATAGEAMDKPREDNPHVRLTAQDIVAIAPEASISEEEFAKRWGQFELRIPKSRFPLAAPNCRSTIILRMPGRDPDAADSERQLRQRWDLFQSLWKIVAQKTGGLDAVLATSPYMRRPRQGGYELEYCNAYFRTPM